MEQGGRIFLRVCAVCLCLSACGGGSHSSTTQTPPPAAPFNLQITPHEGYLRLQWDRVANATAYNIYWSTRSGVNKNNGGKIRPLANTFLHGGLNTGQTYYYAVAAENAYGESAVSAEVSGSPLDVSGTDDPLSGDQWHLDNPVFANEDINAIPVWNSCGDNTCRGEGIRIAVVDDGLEVAHPDLAANAATAFSYNYLNNSNDPSPADPDNGHGTSVAGIIAARDLNDEGVRGVAPRANLAGYNVLTNFTLSNAADAMTRGGPDVHVSSNSWGNEDNTGELDDAPLAWQTAIDTGLSTGRNGLGTIYVFAAGNGGLTVDNANYDGYANHRGVIAVAALNDAGIKASYSEPGANILISAYGGEFCDTHAITTTDLTGGSAGLNTNADSIDYADKDYTKCMNGTSAAAPMVSGAVALMLQANPDLGWRDVRYILATTARQNDPGDVASGWIPNGAGHPVNHKYGFGAVDAAAAVTAATGWTNLGPRITAAASHAAINQPIPDNDPAGVNDTISISGSGINKIEAVEVTFNAADHPYAGDLEIVLTHPGGTASVLAETHPCINPATGSANTCATSYDDWVFTSVRHLDEAADGDWTLTVKDGAIADTGTFRSWRLKIHGRAN